MNDIVYGGCYSNTNKDTGKPYYRLYFFKPCSQQDNNFGEFGYKKETLVCYVNKEVYEKAFGSAPLRPVKVEWGCDFKGNATVVDFEFIGK